MKESEKESDPIVVIAILITVITFIVLAWEYTYSTLKYQSDRGTFGDMFGGLNALFSGFAFGGIILTIYLQSRDLALQRDELRSTREEFKTQNTTLTLQRFDSTFFKSVELLHGVLLGYQETKTDVTPFGQYVININGKDLFKEHGDKLSFKMGTAEEKDIYHLFYEEYKYINIKFEHYFRNLLHIVESIDDLNIKNESSREILQIRHKYIDILKSNLTQYDFLWIFYYCIVIDSSKKYKVMLEKYSFFSEINLLLLINLDHYKLYKTSAFEKII